MIPLNLKLSNFGRFGEEVYVDFSQYKKDENILIVGENRDTPGMDSNGVGKSTLLNAISWAIFGKIPSDAEVGDVIRKGQKRCRIIYEMMDHEGHLIHIDRSRKIKGGHELNWQIDGEDQTRRTMGETQQALLHHFGILENNVQYYNDFLNTTYFSVEAVKAFAGKHSTSRERMDLIARFLNLEILDRCSSRSSIYANNAKAELNRVQNQIEFLESKLDEEFDIEEAESIISEFSLTLKSLRRETQDFRKQLEALALVKSYQDQLEDTEVALERNREDQDTIKNLFQKRISELKEKLVETDQARDELQNQQLILEKLPVDKLKAQINQYEQYIEKSTSIIAKELTISSDLKDQLEKSLTCPECKTPLMLTENVLCLFNPKELKREIRELEIRLEKTKKQLKDHRTESKTVKEQLDKARKLEISISYLEQKLEELRTIPEEIASSKEELRQKIIASQEHQKTLESKRLSLTLKIKKHPELDPSLHADLETNIEINERKMEETRDEISRMETRIKSYEKDLESLEKLKKKEAESQREHANYVFWVEGFPAIRRWMIESFLPSFEEQINTFLHRMEVGIRVGLDTQKEKKSSKVGEMKTQFDFAITDEDGEKRDLETYSTGERKRIGVCTGFALRELTLNKGYSAFDFLLMDEVIDSLDETGILEFFGLLHEISGMKFLITHNTDLKTRFTHVIKVIRENGIATVEQT